jgi:hypothetical protein
VSKEGLELAFPRWLTPTARLELTAKWRIPRALIEAVAGLNALTPRPENDDGASLARLSLMLDR